MQTIGYCIHCGAPIYLQDGCLVARPNWICTYHELQVDTDLKGDTDEESDWIPGNLGRGV